MDGWQQFLAFIALRRVIDDLRDTKAGPALAVPSERRRRRRRSRREAQS